MIQMNDFKPKEFLTSYWQKKPLLIRGAFSSFPELVSADELAGLACEAQVQSRIVLEKGGSRPWEVRKGPFKPSTFKNLPASHWSLLVNGVDHFVPQVSRLLDAFTFIPNWRIEDVMISYATKGGNVGAHVDDFDVFLIQVQGTREWQIETKARKADDYVPGLDIRLLTTFKPQKKWLLEAGDMLYLPPRFPHHGISQSDDCMTYSVGFRAPSQVELFDGAATEALSYLGSSKRYSDPDLRLGQPGEISKSALKQVKLLIQEAMLSEDALYRWFGRYATQRRDDAESIPQEVPLKRKEFIAAFKDHGVIYREEGARLAFIAASTKQLVLFVNGSEMELAMGQKAFVQAVTSKSKILFNQVEQYLQDAKNCQVFSELFNQGVFYFLEDTE